MPEQGPKPREMGYLIAIGQVGLEMVVPIGLGVALDVWLKTLPWITVAAVVLGLVGGMAHLMSLLKQLDQAENSESPNSPREPQ